MSCFPQFSAQRVCPPPGPQALLVDFHGALVTATFRQTLGANADGGGTTHTLLESGDENAGGMKDLQQWWSEALGKPLKTRTFKKKKTTQVFPRPAHAFHAFSQRVALKCISCAVCALSWSPVLFVWVKRCLNFKFGRELYITGWIWSEKIEKWQGDVMILKEWFILGLNRTARPPKSGHIRIPSGCPIETQPRICLWNLTCFRVVLYIFLEHHQNQVDETSFSSP